MTGMMEYSFWTESQNSYPGFVCHVCLKTMSEAVLEKCSGCKLIFYCCKDHQKSHWPRHKEFCKIIQLLWKKSDFSDLISKLFTSEKKEPFLNVIMRLCESIMKRRLTKEECQLLHNPFVCMVCRISKDKKMMVTCKDCCATTYCCEEHKIQDAARHSLSCNEFKNKLEYLKNMNGKVIINAKIKDFINLPINMKSFLDKAIITMTKPLVKDTYALWFLSEVFTIPLTVIYAIEKSLSGKKIEKNTYTVHVVGCRQFENSAVVTWQYIFQHFKMLDTLNLIYIGPEASSHNISPPVVTCLDSIISRKKINFKMESVLYHEYLLKKGSEKPDVIIAFHCGFYDYKCLMKNETWKDSMISMCSFPGAVVAFTSFRESEAKLDLKIFKKSCGADKLRFLVESEFNPFRNVLPISTNENDEISYKNCCITVAKCM